MVVVIALIMLNAIRRQRTARRHGHIDTLFAVVPYLATGLVLAIGLFMSVSGWRHLPA